MGGVGGTGVLRCAQDDGKNKQQQEQTTARANNSKSKQQQEQTTARANNSKNKQQQEQTTARTNNSKDNSRSPAGMTTKETTTTAKIMQP
jgi:hypothetical protein